jgi:hypothetical protein
METGGQIGIELRLLMDKLKGDIASAAKAIKKDLSGPVTGDMTSKADEGMEKTGKEADKLATRINRVSEAARVLKQRLADIASGKLSPVQPGMKVTEAGGVSEAESRQARLEELRRYRSQGLRGYNAQDFFRGGKQGAQQAGLATVPQIGSGPRAYAGPTPPLIPPPVIPPQQTLGQMIAGVLNTTNVWAKGLTAATAALAGLRVVVGLLKYAFHLLLIPLNMVVRQAEAAARLYSKSLTSGGLPIGFTTRRSLLAEVLGVGEQDVLKYASAIRTLNEGLRVSSAVIADSVPALTTIGWEWRMIKVDLQALAMTVANSLVPALHLMFTAIHTEVTKLIQVAQLFRLSPAYQQMMLLARLLGYKEAPAPETSAHRLRSSPWEQMGMVMGIGTAENPIKQTAKNTARSAELLGAIAAAFGLNRGAARTGSMSLVPINLP